MCLWYIYFQKYICPVQEGKTLFLIKKKRVRSAEVFSRLEMLMEQDSFGL